MGPNELLLWMSVRQSGTWSQFRSAVDEMGLDEEEIGREGKVAIPGRVRLRLNLDRLGHVEFHDLNGNNSWRVAPPVLASTNLSGKCIGILCGARSVPILKRLQAGASTLEVVPISDGPAILRLHSADEGELERVASAAEIHFQAAAPMSLLCQLTGIGRHDLGPSAEMPFGRDVVIEKFTVDRNRIEWEKLSANATWSKDDELYRCTRWQMPTYYLKRRGVTYQISGQLGKFLVLRQRRRQVVRYKAQSREIETMAICRPPTLIERALILCSGQLPKEHFARTGKDQSNLFLTYENIDSGIAGIATELLGQSL